MGILEALLGRENPLAQFASNNSSALGAVGAGLAQGPNFSAGLSNAAQLMPNARALDRQSAEATQNKNATVQYLQSKYPDLADAVKNGVPVQSAWSAALTRDAEAAKSAAGGGLTTDIQNYEFSKQHPDFLDFRKGSNQTVRSGLGQPFFGKNKQTGEIAPFQSMSDGTAINLSNPNDPASNYNFDPYIAAGQKAGGTADAKSAAAARAMLPSAQQAMTIASKAISDLRNDKQGQADQFGNILGIPNQVLPAFPGSPMANFRNTLKQGGGQAFMQARAMLKGGGQITDYEGAKAESAFSRMQLSADSGDQAAFNSALDDFEAAVQQGYQKLQEAAAGSYAAGPVPGLNNAAPASPQDVQSILDKYK